MLDYLAVKKHYARKLAEDAEGDGRVESAFYHTMKMVYLKGVEDGEQAARHGDEVRDRIVGVDDQRVTIHVHSWFRTGGMSPGEKRCMTCGAWGAMGEGDDPPLLA